jgi:DNA-binding transcriptional LysR family regulator
MNFMQLRYFVAVAEELSFRRAATRLHISQPPLSFHIKALEEHIGTRLFHRTTREVVLTEAGVSLHEKARRILALVEDAEEEMKDLVAGNGGTLRIGFTISTSFNAFFYNSIQIYRDAFPQVKLTTAEMLSGKQVEALSEGRLDVGFLRWPFACPPNLTGEPIHMAELVIALPRSHPLASAKRISLAKVKDEPFISYPARIGGDIGVYQQILRLCEHSQFAPRVVQEALEPSLIIGLVAAGSGVAIVPSSLRRIQIPGVVFKPIADKSAVTVLHLVYRAADADPRVRAFKEIALRAAKQTEAGN